MLLVTEAFYLIFKCKVVPVMTFQVFWNLYDGALKMEAVNLSEISLTI